MPARNADGMPDFHSLLGGAGGSFTSDESMAAMNSRSADPTSKDDERRNVVLDLAGDEGSVDDLSTNLDKPQEEVEKFDRPFVVLGSPTTFGRSTKETVEPAEMRTGMAWSTSANARQPQRSARPAPSAQPSGRAAFPTTHRGRSRIGRCRRHGRRGRGRQLADAARPTPGSAPPATVSLASGRRRRRRRPASWASTAGQRHRLPAPHGGGRRSTASPLPRAAQRFVGEVKQARQELRGERANYDRPLDGKSVEEAEAAGLQGGEGASPRRPRRHSRKTRSSRPSIRRGAKYEFAGDEDGRSRSRPRNGLPTASSRAACAARSTGTSTATRRAIWWRATTAS